MEDTLVLKKEWIVKCDNCGHDSHCGRDFFQSNVDEFGHKNEYEVCKHCRCEACNK